MNMIYYLLDHFICLQLSHSVTFCFSAALSLPLSFCLVSRSLSTLLAEAFRESRLVRMVDNLQHKPPPPPSPSV